MNIRAESNFSHVPKERHVRKEGYGCTLSCVLGVMRGMTLHLVEVLISKFGHYPKERHDQTLVKRLDPKESHGSFYWQCIGANESHVWNEKHASLFEHQRVHYIPVGWSESERGKIDGLEHCQMERARLSTLCRI